MLLCYAVLGCGVFGEVFAAVPEDYYPFDALELLLLLLLLANNPALISYIFYYVASPKSPIFGVSPPFIMIFYNFTSL